MNKPKASDSVSAVLDPANVTIEFICKECGNVITPGPTKCNQCKAPLISGMDPVKNTVLSILLKLVIPTFIGLIIGLIIRKVDGVLIAGVAVGVLWAMKKEKLFNLQGIWQMMRIGDSLVLEFFCPTSIWEKGNLPVFLNLNSNVYNIFKSGTLKLDEKERTIVKKLLDAKLKPSESNASIKLVNDQKKQPVSQSGNLGLEEQEIPAVIEQEANSKINIIRPSKNMGLALVVDVYLDDTTQIILKNGQTHQIDTNQGNHKIRTQVRGSSKWSEPFTFSTDSGETINLLCKVHWGGVASIERG